MRVPHAVATRSIIVLVLWLGSTCGQATARAADWPMFRGDPARTGVAAGGESSADMAHVAWVFRTGDAVLSSPAVKDGVVYVGSVDGSIYAIDAHSGKLSWSASTGGPVVSSPAVFNDFVYVGGWDGLYRLSTVTATNAGRAYDEAPVDSSPVVADLGNGKAGVYFGTRDGDLVALAAESGQQRWPKRVPELWRAEHIETPVLSSPAVSGGTVFVGGNRALLAFDADTGKPRGQVSLDGTVDIAPAVDSAGFVYVGTTSGSLYVIDARDLNVCSTFNMKTSRFSSPAVSDDKVYIGTDQGLRSLTLTVDSTSQDQRACTLEENWFKPETKAVSGLVSSPVVADGVVYVGGGDGQVYAFDAVTGDVRWSLATESDLSITSSLAIASGVIYVGSLDGSLYAISGGPGTTG